MGGPGPHRGFLLPYTPGASRNCLMLRVLTDFRVMKITALKSSKSLIISVLWVAPLGGLTCSHHSNQVFPLWSRVIPLWNRVTSPLKVLLPQNPGGLLPLCPFYHTSEGASAAEFGPFYHRIRTVTQEPESFYIRNPICPTSESDLFHIRNRAIPPLNPARNLKSQGEFTASRQI